MCTKTIPMNGTQSFLFLRCLGFLKIHNSLDQVQLMRKMHAEIETKSLGTLLTSAEAVN